MDDFGHKNQDILINLLFQNINKPSLRSFSGDDVSLNFSQSFIYS